MLRAYLPPFIISFVICGGLTFYVKKLAERFHWFDLPNPRKIHRTPTPRLGGLAIVITLLIVLFGYIFASHRLTFADSKIFLIDEKVFGMLVGLVIILVVGMFDDIRGVSAWRKLFWQVVAAVVVVAFGSSISFLRLPFGEHLDLTNPQIQFCLSNRCFAIEILGDLISVLWIVLMINTFNFLDGLDGLATGISVITMSVVFFLSISLAQDANALLAIIIAGVAAGFLPWNFNPAKIFLGDSGSMALGFLVGVLAIISGGKLATSFLVLGIPVLDVGWVIFRRLFRGISPFRADRRHFHHRLLTAGLSQKQAVLLLYGVSVLFGSVAVIASTDQKVNALLLLLILMTAFALTLVILELRKKKIS